MHNGKVKIVDWYELDHEMTPDELLDRVKGDHEKSGRLWLAPATEIVRVISDPNFPEPIANELKSIILEYSANALLFGNDDLRSIDFIAVAYCYYSLHGKAGKRSKRLYRENLIKSAIRDVGMFLVHIHGREYKAFCSAWKKDALQHFTERFGIDFMRFEANIKVDFGADVKRAIEAGEFKNDELEHKETMRKIFEDVLGDT